MGRLGLGLSKGSEGRRPEERRGRGCRYISIHFCHTSQSNQIEIHDCKSRTLFRKNRSKSENDLVCLNTRNK